jgi:hypothetical protein
MLKKRDKMKKQYLTIKYLAVVFMLGSNLLIGQETSTNILWNKELNVPVAYATITSAENSLISNENGAFSLQKRNSKITIKSVGYETREVDYDILRVTDTVYMKSFTYELNEVVISRDGLYKRMLKKILTDYVLEPHKERFFLRAIVRKNNQLYKIVDLAGIVEKQALFDLSSRRMPKKNYKVQLENLRKVGRENRELDYKMFGFKEFFTNVMTVGFNIENFNTRYETTSDIGTSKLILNPKDKVNQSISAFYIVDDDNTFKEIDVQYDNTNGELKPVRKSKYKTSKSNWKVNFERNAITNKYQLSKAILSATTEVHKEQIKDIFECNYIYVSIPVDNLEKISSNVNLDKDIFDLEIDYNSEYWNNNEILKLTNEMQDFINKVNSSGKNSNFRTKSNIK